MKITTVADISGRISQDKHDADRITGAALCLPGGALDYIRKRIPARLPKWRDAADDDVRLAVNIVMREALGVGVYSVEKTAPEWETFWSDASDIRMQTRGKISFVKAAYQVKCLLFVQSTTLACATTIRNGNVVRLAPRRHGLSTHETLVLDNEIDGPDNIDVFKSIWQRMNAGQQLSEVLGIRRNFVDVQLKTEQQDRLLLLADYVAGIAHAFVSQADVLAASKVSAACVQHEQERLSRMPQYQLLCDPFMLKFSEILGTKVTASI